MLNLIVIGLDKLAGQKTQFDLRNFSLELEKIVSTSYKFKNIYFLSQTFEIDAQFLKFFPDAKAAPNNISTEDHNTEIYWNESNQSKRVLISEKYPYPIKEIANISAFVVTTMVDYSTQQFLIIDYKEMTLKNFNAQNLYLDSSLPKEYIYLEHNGELEQGYSTKWILVPGEYLTILQRLEDFVVDAIKGENSYFLDFTINGWPLSVKRSTVNQKWKTIGNILWNRYKLSTLFLELDNSRSTKESPFMHRVNKRISRILGATLQKLFGLPILSAEYSYIPHNYSRTKQTYDESMSYKKESLLKYFFFLNGLRDKTRFVKSEDFFLNPYPGTK